MMKGLARRLANSFEVDFTLETQVRSYDFP